MYYELAPAYGRDYKSAKDVTAAFQSGADFQGDYSMGFRLCSIRDLDPGSTVLLRYKRNTMVTSVKVKSTAVIDGRP